MVRNWKDKVEKDIQTLAQSMSKLSISLEKFIEHSKEMQTERFSQINEQLQDHEKRIRNNSKFVYQALAVIGVSVMLFNILNSLNII